jgi:hypothetical protein
VFGDNIRSSSSYRPQGYVQSKAMKKNTAVQRKQLSPVFLTVTGILLGLLLALLAVWADYESTSYEFLRRAQAPLRGLTCPVFLGKNESSVVSLTISNPTDRILSPGVWIQISTSSALDSKVDHIQLAPGEQITLHRSVGPENVDLGMFIFVDAFVYSVYPLPDRETTCGILVLPVFSGTSLLIFGTALSVVFMTTGTYFLYRNEQATRRSPSTLFIVIATALAMTSGYLGWWFPALILIILAVLTLMITAGSFFT